MSFKNEMRKWAEKEEKTKMMKIANLISFSNIKKHGYNVESVDETSYGIICIQVLFI